MSLTAFDKFVQQEQQKSTISPEAFDPFREQEEWLQALRELHELVKQFLDSYVKSGQIELSFRDITINEEQVGSYRAPEMLIRIGTKTIQLEPVGTFLIGSKGRVDVIGPYARTRLLLMDSRIRRASDMIHVSVGINGRPPAPQPPVPEPIEWVWRMITRPPELKIIALTKDSFLDMLLEIANG